MADAPITFTHKEMVELLVKAKGLHEGIWGLYVEFGLGAVNIGPNDDEVNPAAFVTIGKIGLQRFTKESSLSVDAAKVNPTSTARRRALPGRAG